jgi:GH18 family chitinase
MRNHLFLFRTGKLPAHALALCVLCWLNPHAFGRSPAHRPLLVGYFTQGGDYSPAPFFLRTLVINGSAERLDQINYSAASVRGGRCSVADPLADLLTTYVVQNSVDGTSDDPVSPVRGNFHQLRNSSAAIPG